MGGVISLSDMNSELLGKRWWRYIKNEIDGCWKEVNKKGAVSKEVLVWWSHLPAHEATWVGRSQLYRATVSTA